MHRLALAAAGGAAVLLVIAAAADAADRLLGLPGGLVFVGAVFGGCGLVFRRPRRTPRLTRPAGDVTVTNPKPLAGLPR